MFGIGYHHAGVESSDRKTVEALFTAGELPVLCECPACSSSQEIELCSLKYASSFHQHLGYGGMLTGSAL